jgi:hypothetical protein
MKLPLQNRITAKAVMPNFLNSNTNLHKDELEYMIKQKMCIGVGNELMNKIGIDKIGAVGNDNEVEYRLELYMFTRDQLAELIDSAYGEGYQEGIYDAENK